MFCTDKNKVEHGLTRKVTMFCTRINIKWGSISESPRPTRERARSVLAARRLYLTGALCLVWAHVCGPISTFLFGSNRSAYAEATILCNDEIKPHPSFFLQPNFFVL
jgi:hypothetical protein